ncbi:hypothetical protein WJX77_001291 [Trebouxia sp. C0004]
MLVSHTRSAAQPQDGHWCINCAFAIPANKPWLTAQPIESLTYERLRTSKVHGLLHDPEALLQLVTFILVGDHAQLSAVCYHRLPKISTTAVTA